MNSVERMNEDFSLLLGILQASGEISLLNSVEENFRRNMLLAAASFFEAQLIDAVLNYAGEVTTEKLLQEFVRVKGVERQYHSWFEWDTRNANKFFGLFGVTFKDFMKRRLTADPDLKAAVESFMSIGGARNRLVHTNFGSFVHEQTGAEVYESYKTAQLFVDRVPELLRECSKL